MIEKDLVDFLNDKLTVPAYTMRPADAPERFVLIEKTSGGMNNFIESVSVVIQSHDKTSLLGAAELNEEVKRIMLQAPILERIGGVRLNSDYNFTDTSMKEYRYQALYNISYKGV